MYYYIMVFELLILVYILLLGFIYYIITRNDIKLAMYFIKIIGILVTLEVLYIGYYYLIKGSNVCHMMKSIACRNHGSRN